VDNLLGGFIRSPVEHRDCKALSDKARMAMVLAGLLGVYLIRFAVLAGVLVVVVYRVVLDFYVRYNTWQHLW